MKFLLERIPGVESKNERQVKRMALQATKQFNFQKENEIGWRPASEEMQ